MKNYLFAIAATVLVAACNPTEVELIEPETPETETPGGNNNGTTKPSEENDFNNNHYWLIYKEGLFELLNTSTNERGQFEINQAERLLRTDYPNSIWVVPSDAPYVFSVDNGLRFDRNKLK